MTKQTDTEIQILKSCAAGNTAAFEAIVQRYQSLVCAITYSAVGQVEKSEELAQQVFINAWKGLSTLKNLEKFKAWLIGITRNVIRDWFRNQKRDIVAKAVPIDKVGDTADSSSEPLEMIITREQEALVHQSLQQIPEKYREPMVLFYRQQQSARQVAEALDLTEETVRTRLMRGRKMLKEQVSQMIETTLSHTGPGKTFTTMVVASITGLALTSTAASAATAVTTSTAASSTATGVATVMSTITAKIITAAAVIAVAVGAAFAVKQMAQSDHMPIQPEHAGVVQEESIAAVSEQDAQLGPEVEEKPAEIAGKMNELSDSSAELNMQSEEPPVEPAETVVVANTVQMGIHVFDGETEQPISGAQLRVNRGCGCNCEPNYYTTEDNGYYNIDFGEEKPPYLSILVTKAGHVPQMFAWRDEMLENLEKEFAFFLPKGNKIGGRVQNEKGEPVASAKLTIRMNEDESREHPWARINDYEVKTDPNGRWVCDIYPEQPHRFSIKMSHEDYADTKKWINDREYKYEDFYNLKSTLVMQEGVFLSGTVVDVNGSPIKDAKVFTYEDRFDSDAARTKTDSQGHFEFEHFLPDLYRDKIVLTVQAKGYAPELELITMQEEIPPVTISLGRSNTIRVRVVDVNGNPVVGAGVDVDNWRNLRSLSWKNQTDSEGRFVWNEAPADEVDIDIYKEKFLRISEKFVAQEQEYQVTMLPTLVVSGTVVDAETKEPIPHFRAMKGIQWDSGRIHWQSDNYQVKDFSGGEYKFSFNRPHVGHLVRIDAEGYLPAKSRVFDSNEATVTYDFELIKGTGHGGIVYEPNGFPAEGADVYIVMKGKHLSFENGKPSDAPDDDKWAQTDIDGEFLFKGLLEDTPYKLVVMHDEGFTEVSQQQWQKDPNIYLERWGRIEGTLYSGLTAEANQGVNFNARHTNNDPQGMSYYYGLNVVTDEQGRFKMERVIPGQGFVSRRIKSENGRRTFYSGHTDVEVISGQAAYIDIGGGGRTVTGTLIKPEWAVDTVDFSWIHPNIKTLQSETMNPYEAYADMEFPMPERFDEMTVAEVMQWFQEWAQSPEGQEYQKEVEKRMKELGINDQRRYNCMVEYDGSFRIIDVLPDDYILSCQLRKATPEGHADYKEPVVAEIKYTFTVSDITEESQDIPVELGAIEFSHVAEVEAGQQVPDFSVYTDEGNPLKPGDFSGKYVLITFYFATNEGGADEMKNLKRIQDDFSADQRFEMLGITQAGIPLLEKLAQKYLDEFGLTWQQGFIDGRNYELMQTFKIQSWPYSILIAPDGTMITTGLKGDELYQAVSDALAEDY